MSTLLSNYSEKALLVEGCAGSGKTSLIAKEAASVLNDGNNALLLTFSLTGRNVLESYLGAKGHISNRQTQNDHKKADEARPNNNLFIETIDAFAYRYLKEWGDERYVLDKRTIVLEILPEVLNELAENQSLPEDCYMPSLNEANLYALMDDLDFYRASKAFLQEDPFYIEDICSGKLNFEIRLVQTVFYAYDRVREYWRPSDSFDISVDSPLWQNRKGLYGFRQISEACYDLYQLSDGFSNINIKYWESLNKTYTDKYKITSDNAKNYDLLCIDEFHDTTPLQLDFILAMASSSKRVLAVGDRRQNIFIWRGTDTDIVFNEFSHQAWGTKKVYMPDCHRFGHSLAKFASPFSAQTILSKTSYDSTIKEVENAISFLSKESANKQYTVVVSTNQERVKLSFDLFNSKSSLKQNFNLGANIAVGISNILFLIIKPDFKINRALLGLASEQFLSQTWCNLNTQARQEISQSTSNEKVRQYVLGYLKPEQKHFSQALKNALNTWLHNQTSSLLLSEMLQNFADESGLLKQPNSLPGNLYLQSSWTSLINVLKEKKIQLDDWPKLYQQLLNNHHKEHGLTMLTVNEVKGREFDHVLVYGANAQGFIQKQAISDLARNKFYVAITRAKASLVLAQH